MRLPVKTLEIDTAQIFFPLDDTLRKLDFLELRTVFLKMLKKLILSRTAIFADAASVDSPLYYMRRQLRNRSYFVVIRYCINCTFMKPPFKQQPRHAFTLASRRFKAVLLSVYTLRRSREREPAIYDICQEKGLDPHMNGNRARLCASNTQGFHLGTLR